MSEGVCSDLCLKSPQQMSLDTPLPPRSLQNSWGSAGGFRGKICIAKHLVKDPCMKEPCTEPQCDFNKIASNCGCGAMVHSGSEKERKSVALCPLGSSGRGHVGRAAQKLSFMGFFSAKGTKFVGPHAKSPCLALR